jgi:4'-phosphopantetheinyl transferase
MLASTALHPDLAFALDSVSVHVWHTDLAVLENDTEEQLAILDEIERLRASRLKMEQDRAQFIAAHAAARMLIGKYLGRPARTICFGYEPNGKPFAIRSAGEPDLRFNASRTSNRAAFALTMGREVGIDIERIADYPHLAEAYARALSANERELVSALPTECERQKAFFALWVRKEAVLKAGGRGLATAPSEMDVTRATIRGEAKREWRVKEIACDSGWAAAVAAEGDGWCLGPIRTCREWLS